MRKLFHVLIGVGLGTIALGGGSATAAPGAMPSIAADSSVIFAHYRGWGYYGGYGRRYGYYGRSYGRGYGYYGRSYGHGYYGRSYGRGYGRW